MFDTYRAVLSVPGTLRFSAAAFVGRLPMAMFSLGIVLLVSEARGSYGVAGGVAAVYLIANGIFSIIQGRLLDRLGQSLVLGLLMASSAGGMVLLMTAVQSGWPLAWVYLGAVISGATFPQIGAAVRARWSHVLRDPAKVQTAFALEGALDEGVFMLGPILVTALATAVHPLAGLGSAVVAGLIGTAALAVQRSTEPPPRGATVEHGVRHPMPWSVVAPLVVVCFCLGVMFGSSEVTAVAFAEEQGAKAQAGVLLALWALGSFSAGIASGAVRWPWGPAIRVPAGCLGLVVVIAPLSLIPSMGVMAGFLLIAGLAVAPTLIATMSLCEQVAPPGRLTEAMSIVHTGLVAGVAPGAAVAGLVIDHQGASAAFLVALAAAALGFAAALRLPAASRALPSRAFVESQTPPTIR